MIIEQELCAQKWKFSEVEDLESLHAQSELGIYFRNWNVNRSLGNCLILLIKAKKPIEQSESLSVVELLLVSFTYLEAWRPHLAFKVI